MCRCRYTHDVDAKFADLRVPSVDEISEEPPLNIHTLDEASATPHSKYPSLDMGTVCPVFAETGECRYVFCLFYVRFLFLVYNNSLDTCSNAVFLEAMYAQTRQGTSPWGDEDKKTRSALTAQEVNFIGPETQKLLRTKKVCFPSFFWLECLCIRWKVCVLHRQRNCKMQK